jgi:hypothetical protein
MTPAEALALVEAARATLARIHAGDGPGSPRSGLARDALGDAELAVDFATRGADALALARAERVRATLARLGGRP